MKKFFSFLITMLLLLSIVGCTTHQKPPITEDSDDTEKEQSPEGYEEQKLLYNDIITYYTALLTSKQIIPHF